MTILEILLLFKKYEQLLGFRSCYMMCHCVVCSNDIDGFCGIYHSFHNARTYKLKLLMSALKWYLIFAPNNYDSAVMTTYINNYSWELTRDKIFYSKKIQLS